ncbi:MAG: hypothetical protein JXP34_03805 [Planctomycetes bacterium]|nr:hypothetical protein [Planctomycetota bacterium]
MDLRGRIELGDDLAIAVRRGRFLRTSPRVVPQGAFAYRIDDSSTLAGGLLRAGDPIRPKALHFIFPEAPRTLRVALPPLESAEGLRLEACFELEARVPSQETAIRLFLTNVAPEGGAVPASRAAAALSDALRDPARSLMASRSVEDLPLGEDREALAALLRDALGGPILSLGLDLVRVRDGALRAPDYEALRRDRIELKLREERVANTLRFHDLWRKVELGERLAREEVETVVRHLRREGVLKEIDAEREAAARRREIREDEALAAQELRHLLDERELAHSIEIDAKKLEREIERTRRMNEVMDRAGIRAHIAHLRDDRAKARLYRALIEAEMTPDQIAARGPQATIESIREELDDAVRRIQGLVRSSAANGGSAGTGALPVPKLVAAAGRRVISIDPARTGPRARPEVIAALEEGPLGSLRSIRVACDGADSWLLAGAQRGIYAIDPRNPSRRILFRMPSAPEGRGGANASAIRDGFLYATHSEVGVARWPLADPLRGEVILADATRSASSVRGVQFDGAGRGVLAAGDRLLRFDPASCRVEAPLLRLHADTITTFAVAPEGILVGTRGGRLWWCAPDCEPASWPSRAGPITAIRIAERDEGRFAVVAAREPIVWVRALAGDRAITFRSEGTVVWVAASEGAVFGVDRFGLAIEVWRWERPDAPERRIRSEDEVRDVEILAGEGICAQS